MPTEITTKLTGEWMTPRRRFLSALYRGHVDKVPACTLSSVMTVELMDMVDAPFPEAHLDAEMMARLAATSHEVLGMDTIMPVWHSQLESDAAGRQDELGGEGQLALALAVPRSASRTRSRSPPTTANARR